MTTPSDTFRYFSSSAVEFGRQYDHSPAFRERFEVWSRLIATHAAKATTAIDAGCGAGTFSFLLADRSLRVVGIDPSPGMIETCREQARQRTGLQPTFIQGALPALEGIELDPADLVISSSVLEYVPDLPLAVRRLHGLVKPGGLLIASLPNARSLYRRLEAVSYRLIGRPAYLRYVLNRLTAEDFAALARQTGFDLVEESFYAHGDPLSRLLRSVGVPPALRANLFVSVLRRS